MQVKPKELRKVTEELGQPTAKDKKRAEVSALLQILYNQILLFFFFFNNHICNVHENLLG